VSCTICSLRKEKRFCPALHTRICAQCCGEQREVTLDCPSDCPYLLQAREHENPRDRGEVDQDAVFPEVDIGGQYLYQQENLLVGLSFTLARSARASSRLVDRDLIAALTSLAKTYQTLVNSALIVAQRNSNLDQQAITDAIENLVKEYREEEQKHTGISRLRDEDLLKALVFLVRLGLARTSGRPKSRAFIDFLRAQFPENPSVIAGSDEAGSRIIVP
jgi:hypothetical protein